jgi:hypothetical protein
MPRDSEIRLSFEHADDAMQAAIGYYMYVLNAWQIALTYRGKWKVPHRMQITHEWARIYSPDEYLHTMNKIFPKYHRRVCLISLVGIFENAIKDFIRRLLKLRKIKKLTHDNYKTKLIWVYGVAKQSKYGTLTMQRRIISLCRDVDHARRIRNLWLHNNGVVNNQYFKDGIVFDGNKPKILGWLDELTKATKAKISLILNESEFLEMCYSHIELLHDLHDTLQRKYFHQILSYGYKSANKHIEWKRLLSAENPTDKKVEFIAINTRDGIRSRLLWSKH